MTKSEVKNISTELEESGVAFDKCDLSNAYIPTIVQSAINASVLAYWGIRESRGIRLLIKPITTFGAGVCTGVQLWVLLGDADTRYALAAFLFFAICYVVSKMIRDYTRNNVDNRRCHSLVDLYRIKGDINQFLKSGSFQEFLDGGVIQFGFLSQLNRIATFNTYYGEGKLDPVLRKVILQEHSSGFESLFRCENCADEFFIAVCRRSFPLFGYDLIYIIPDKDMDTTDCVEVTRVK